MKTVMLSLLLAASPLGMPGCWPGWQHVEEPSLPAPPAAVAPRSPRPPVTADKVNAGNAREMAETLLEEIDREQSGGR